MPWRHECDLGSVHAGFVVNKVALSFLASTSGFPYQYDSTKYLCPPLSVSFHQVPLPSPISIIPPSTSAFPYQYHSTKYLCLPL